MSTPPRIEVPGGFYHVTARGNSKQTIYRDDFERELFLALLDRTAGKYRWVVLAYCLMGNHYHLLLQIPFGGLSGGFNVLNTGFARIVNRRRGRSDHLFGRRFSSLLLERDSHLLETARYVVLNPVRGGLCERPEDWRWSSYRACAGLDLARRFLAADELLAHFGNRPARAREAFCRFVAEGHVSVAATVAEV